MQFNYAFCKCSSFFLLLFLTCAVSGQQWWQPQQPKQQQKQRPRVVIVGGGIAGCAAAWKLQQNFGADVDLRIVEAQDRLGGRIHSVDLNAGTGREPKIIELGANWIHGTDRNTLFHFAYDHSLLDIADEIKGAEIMIKKSGKTPDPVLVQMVMAANSLIENERRAFYDNGVLPGDLTIDQRERWFPENDTLSYTTSRQKELFIEEYFDRNRTGNGQWTRDKLQMYHLDNMGRCDTLACGNLSQVSLGGYGSLKLLEGGDLPLKSGLSSIIRFFQNSFEYRVLNRGEQFEKISDRATVYLNTAIDSINWGGDEIQLQTTDGSTLKADLVLVTVSLGCLKEGRPAFSPPLPDTKTKAIDDVGMGTLDKIFFIMDSTQLKLWKSIPGGPYKTVKFLWDPIEVVDPNAMRETWMRGITNCLAVADDVLLFFIHGEEAKFLETLSDAEVQGGIDMIMNTFFQTPFGTFRRKTSSIRRSSWNSNRYTVGSYSFSGRAETSPGVRSLLAEPLKMNGKEKVLFAGEATSWNWHSTMHGAFETAMIQAQNLQRLLMFEYLDYNLKYNDYEGYEYPDPDYTDYYNTATDYPVAGGGRIVGEFSLVAVVNMLSLTLLTCHQHR